MAGIEQFQPAKGEIPAALAKGAALLDIQPAAAALHARGILKVEPHNAAAFRLLARALDRLGETDQARQARTQALVLAPREPDIAAANQALNEGRYGDIPALLARRIAEEPDDPVALLMLGEAAIRAGKFADAAAHLQQSVALAPEYTPARMALARAHYRRFEPREALAVVREAPVLDVASRRFEATLLAELDDHEQAAAILAELVAAHPREPGLIIQHGDMLRTLGNKASAASAYRAAISASREMGRAWWALAALDPALFDAAEASELASLYGAATNPDHRMHFAFALARLCDHQGQHERALALFTEANALHRKLLPWNAGPFLERNQAVIGAIKNGLFDRKQGFGVADGAPIFIVGMARSGSTLIEHMLSRHSQIAAGGEMPAISALLREAAAMRGLDPETDAVRLLESLSAEDARLLGEEYLRRARQRCAGPEAHFTDKLPHNWAELAFIHLILPNAKIIDMRRSLIDCAVSNFALLFSPGHPASYDLDDFAAYAGAYINMIDAFGSAAAPALIKVQYEQLVASPEQTLRDLFQQLGLPFEEACLSFEQSARSVATASAEQVRKPLSASSIESWRRFEQWLGGLPAALSALTPR